VVDFNFLFQDGAQVLDNQDFWINLQKKANIAAKEDCSTESHQWVTGLQLNKQPTEWQNGVARRVPFY
jgi:hypothetical protein